jgi:hypothetical protein
MTPTFWHNLTHNVKRHSSYSHNKGDGPDSIHVLHELKKIIRQVKISQLG